MTRYVHSYGMGADSTALVLEWDRNPGSRPCPLDELVVVTAMTGDEWKITGRLATEHVLPVFRRHRIRFVQLARTSARQADGVTVLDDSRDPRTVHLDGAYKLSAEMLAAGTVAQVAGCRKCSLKSKGWVIDSWLRGELAGEPYSHVMGYEANEGGRARSDVKHTSGRARAPRSGSYPLIEWGWDRAACEEFIHAVTGVWWPKSACSACPYPLCSADGRARTLISFAAYPAEGVLPLVMEHIAVSLNPRQSLAPDQRLSDLLARAGRHGDVLARFDAELDRLPWHVFDVRRAVRAKRDGSGQAANITRSLRTVTVTDRAGAADALTAAALERGVPLTVDGGIPRGWLRRRGDRAPTGERHLVACPVTVDGPHDKDGPGFDAAWAAADAAADGTLDLGWS